MEQINSTGRSSGIPRPTSRLPVLAKRGSVLIAKPSQDGLQPQLAANATPRLAKRTSIASLPSNGQARPASRPAPRAPSTGTSRTRPAIRSTSSKSSLASLNRTNSLTATYQSDEDVDRLSSLNTYRASSRQSSYDDDHGITTGKVRKSRPSLSDRAMESIQAVPTTPKDRRQSNFFVSDSPMGPPPRPSSVMSNSNSTTSRPGTSDGTFTKPTPQSSAKMPMSAKPAPKTAGNGFGYSQTGRRTSSLTAKLQSARSTPRPSDVDAPVTARKVSASRPAATTSNSSAALRQQIAAAKAAAKKEREAALHDSPREGQDVEVHDDFQSDPFNQAPKDGKHILRNRIRSARLDGRLNIAAMQLHEMPDEVMTMYSTASIEQSNISWAELVDLTRFIASDNEFETISETVFPDLSREELEQDEDAQVGQFGGIEMLDFHNNILTSVPTGLRRLERLTSLNLTHNRLENSSLEVIAQIKSLRELKLGHNSISGTLPSALCSLQSLEVLELQSNRLLALPEAISGLSRLKALNVSANQLTSLPMDALSHLPLQELDASSNALIASLFPLGGISEHRTLRSLNLANNSIAALTFSPELFMPELQTLDVTNNHLAVLPPVATWTKLAVLYAGDNKLPDLPEGFTKLEHLRIANLSGNELHLIPAEIALMDSLTTLVLASNPLRQKKYLTMAAADIKQDLRSFLNQTPEEYDDEVASWGTAPEAPSHASGWTLKSGGLLDLANKGLTDAINDSLGAFLGSNEVKQLHLQGNKLTVFPPALFLGQDLRFLDLSNNPLEADYISDDIELPSLVELSLSSCRISSLKPLLQHLGAPNLHILQINGNRLAGDVPDLHATYPSLLTLLASDNKFDTVTADVLCGYNTVDLTSNELQNLPAEIGLLWEEGLKSFEVGRNAFRVPGHRVLEKGTQATMRWLRDRIKVDATEGATDENPY